MIPIKTSLRVALFLAAMAFLQSSLSAATLVLYPFAGNSALSTDTDLNSVASAFSNGGGVGLVFSGTGNPSPSAAMQQAQALSAGTAVTSNDYFEFTLTPDAGYEMDLTSLSLQVQRSDASAPTNYFVRTSLDSFTTDLIAPTALTTSFVTNTPTLGAAYQDLTAPITFRIYAYGATNATSSLRIDNVTLNGTLVAVPEPNTYALLGFGMTALFFLRRQRKA